MNRYGFDVSLTPQARQLLHPAEALVLDWHRMAICCAGAGEMSLYAMEEEKANGADIISADGLTSQLDDPKVAEALTFATSLITAHGDGPSFFDFRANGEGGVDFFGPDNQFAADTLGAMPMEQTWRG